MKCDVHGVEGCKSEGCQVWNLDGAAKVGIPCAICGWFGSVDNPVYAFECPQCKGKMIPICLKDVESLEYKSDPMSAEEWTADIDWNKEARQVYRDPSYITDEGPTNEQMEHFKRGGR